MYGKGYIYGACRLDIDVFFSFERRSGNRKSERRLGLSLYPEPSLLLVNCFWKFSDLLFICWYGNDGCIISPAMLGCIK